MKGEVVMMTNNGAITSMRIATSWTDDHDPVVVDIVFATHEKCVSGFQSFSNIT